MVGRDAEHDRAPVRLASSPGGSAAGGSPGPARRAARRWRRDRACRRGRPGAARRPCAAWRRRRATSSPAGLSTTTSPSVASAGAGPGSRPLTASRRQGALHAGDDRVDRVVAREPGGEAVAAAALASAMRRTSTSPSERRLTRTVPSASSFSTHATSASAVRRTMSIRPSTSSIVTPWRAQVVLGHRRPHEPPLGHELARARAPRRASCRYAKRCSSNSVRLSVEIGTSNSTSSRAMSNTAGVVVSYWKRPVSQTSAA